MQPATVGTAKGLTLAAPAPTPVKGHPSSPIEWGERIVPSRVRATWTRNEDGLTVQMIVNTTPHHGPIAEWFLVRPSDGVTGNSNDYRMPIRTMAKLAATKWGYDPLPVDIDDLRQRHLNSKAKQDRRYKIVAEAGNKAKSQGLPMPEYVLAQLHAAGFTEIKEESTVYKLRTEAKKLGYIQDDKAAS